VNRRPRRREKAVRGERGRTKAPWKVNLKKYNGYD
jgi:hypothetical protein